MPSMDIVLSFDTEDIFHGPEVGNDDIIKTLADILSEEGVPGNFILIGKRAKLLEDRGRQDVIDAIKCHSVGVHTLSQEQPYASVEAAELDWHQGLELYRKSEGEAVRLVAEAIDDQPMCISGHAANGAPHALVVAKEMGLPYLYGYAAAPPLYNVSRYCGAINFPYAVTPPGKRIAYWDNHDGLLMDDGLSNQSDFDMLLDKFDEYLHLCHTDGHPIMMIHPCHPFRVRTIDWIDGFMTANGRNIPPDEQARRPMPALRPEAQVEIAKQNFRRLARFVKKHPLLNPVSVPDAVKRCGPTPGEITSTQLLDAAQQIVDQNRIVITGGFSPAEHIVAFADAILIYAREKTLPDHLIRYDVLGPLEDPIMIPEPPAAVSLQNVLSLAQMLLDEVKATGYLPANLAISGGDRVGLGSIYAVLAEAYQQVATVNILPEMYNLKVFDRQPKIGVSIGTTYATRLAEARVVKPNLNIDKMYRYAKLQAWTLASAWPKDV